MRSLGYSFTAEASAMAGDEQVRVRSLRVDRACLIFLLSQSIECFSVPKLPPREVAQGQLLHTRRFGIFGDRRLRADRELVT